VIDGRRVLAVVPARSGSKGIANKNMREVAGRTLIAWAGDCLARATTVDARYLSTDSERYAREGIAHGLAAPYLRPPELASDTAGAVDTMIHALTEAEAREGGRFDLLLIVEPTSPLRLPEDIDGAVRLLVQTGADSVVTVSAAPAKFLPRKLLCFQDQRLTFLVPEGATVRNRQELGDSPFYRNGVCYAVTRDCLLERKTLFTPHTRGLVIDRPTVNIDEPIELELAEFLLRRAPPSF
jgi:CMP-N,N'-diacetyllegionaminic acid synthase